MAVSIRAARFGDTDDEFVPEKNRLNAYVGQCQAQATGFLSELSADSPLLSGSVPLLFTYESFLLVADCATGCLTMSRLFYESDARFYLQLYFLFA